MVLELDEALLNDLCLQAKKSPRLRMNLDLRTSPDDQSQRMLNALVPGTALPIHRHPLSTEVVVVLRGRMDEIFYDEEGRETARFHLNPLQGNFGLNIPAGQWHGIEVFEPTVIIEAKDGSYTPTPPEDLMQK